MIALPVISAPPSKCRCSGLDAKKVATSSDRSSESTVMKIFLMGSAIVSALLPALVVASLVASYSVDSLRRSSIKTYGVRGTGFIWIATGVLFW